MILSQTIMTFAGVANVWQSLDNQGRFVLKNLIIYWELGNPKIATQTTELRTEFTVAYSYDSSEFQPFMV